MSTEQHIGPRSIVTKAGVGVDGPGYLGGEAPEGRTTVGGVPVSADVDVFYELDTKDWQHVASTTSQPDGTWSIVGLNPDKKFNVVARHASFGGVIAVDVQPSRTDIVTLSGAFTTNDDFNGVAGFMTVESGMPPFTASVVDPLPYGLNPLVVDGRKLIIDGTSDDAGLWESVMRVTDSNSLFADVPVSVEIRSQGDPLFDKVVLLLHCSGANNSTTFTDSSSTPKTVTAYGVAKISTAYSQFPDGALELSGLDSGLNLGELLSPGTPYCMEAFVRLNASDAGGQYTHSIFSQSGNVGDGDQYFGIEFESRPNPLKLHFYRGASIAGGRKEAYGSVPVARETRVHVALSFDGSKIRGFLEGQLQFEVSDTQGWANTGEPLRVGQNIVPIYSQYRTGFQGCIAGVRLTVDDPRYTSNFAVPPFPLPSQ